MCVETRVCVCCYAHVERCSVCGGRGVCVCVCVLRDRGVNVHGEIGL